MAETELWTYQDAVEHVLDFFDVDRTARNLRLARKAILTAYGGIPDMHRWSYLMRRYQLTTEASQDFTATFDYTGGAYELVLTLSSGSWPTNAALGQVIIGTNVYPIDERKSSTEVTLSATANPGADVAAGTVTWFRSSYTLPVNFRACYELKELSNAYDLEFIQPADLLERMMGSVTPSRPYCYTIRNTSDYYGTLEVELCPPPSESRTYDALMTISPRGLATEKYSDGTVSVSAGSTTVTGSGTAFTAAHVGSIIRFSSNGSSLPTSIVGSPIPDPSGTDNPYYAQRVVVSVASATSLTIDAVVSSSSALSSVKYTISDPIDIEAGSMLKLFWRSAELEFARQLRAPDLPQLEKALRDELISAAGSDNRNLELGRFPTPRWRYYTRLTDWAIIE